MRGCAQTSEAMCSFATLRRVALTGSPLMNNLTEFFHMLSWACPGYFPDKDAFDRAYTNPIETGRQVGASRRQQNTMLQQACLLCTMVQGIMHRVGPDWLAASLPPKVDMLLSLRMPCALEAMYRILSQKVRFDSALLEAYRSTLLNRWHANCQAEISGLTQAQRCVSSALYHRAWRRAVPGSVRQDVVRAAKGSTAAAWLPRCVCAVSL